MTAETTAAEATQSVPGLREQALVALGTLVPRRSAVAFVNFPNHGNPGDSAIWLGTLSLLRSLSARIVYRASWWDLDIPLLRRLLPQDGTILINGGGNFGDLYAGQQQQRERLLREVRGVRIVQLPQSIHFRDQANLERMRELIASHGSFSLMVREQNSLRVAQSELTPDVVLSPDHAFGLVPRRRRIVAARDILWNSWGPTATEYRADSAPPAEAPDVTTIDWIDGASEASHNATRGVRAAFALNGREFDRVQHHEDLTDRDRLRLSRTYEPMAEAWTRRGFDLLASARVVVTNKLHAHIFCALTGQPHVVLDNSYGKVSSTLATWTHTLPGVHVATHTAEALQVARALVKRLEDG